MIRKSDRTDSSSDAKSSAKRDIIALGIAVAAIILFVGTGGSLLPQLVRAWMGLGEKPDLLLTNALLLNIALLIFGWRRYRELNNELRERRKAETLARQLSETDPLTGCLNRRSVGPAFDAMCGSAKARNAAAAVLMLDIDNFKQLNDLNGHQLGDQVLRIIADRIRSAMPAGSILARLGGDEFVCLMVYDPADNTAPDQFAARLMEAVSGPIKATGLVTQATVSVGIADTQLECSAHSQSNDLPGELLIHRADIAMYHAKKSGRNRCARYEPQMEEDLRLRNELEAAIRSGITAREFVPYYEQQIDLETGGLVGFEMLARWNSPKFGLVSPDIFIPVAEELDLISDLSEDVIRQALQDAKEWDPSITLSVNISPKQMRDPWFAQKIIHLLAECGFPAGRLELEITESCLHENLPTVRSILTSLKNQGIRISLDDFGTGYSSLSQLRALPFDRLKIDRSFVAELTREGGNSELVKAIIALGRGLSLPVTAEGVESSTVREMLREMGQMKGQGYLYGKPEDAATTRVRLEQLKMLVVKPQEPAPVPLAPALQRKAS